MQKKHSLGSDACRNIKNHVARVLWLGVGTGCVPIDDVAVKDVPLEPHLHKMPNLLSRLAFVSALKTKCFEDFFCVVLSVMHTGLVSSFSGMTKEQSRNETERGESEM